MRKLSIVFWGTLALAAVSLLLPQEGLAQTLVVATPAAPPTDTSPPSDDAPSLARAEASLGEYLFDEALQESQRVIKKGGLPQAQFAKVLRVKAQSLAALSRPEEAQQAYLELLVVDPRFVIDPKLGPRIRAPFFEAQASLSSGAPPSMQVQRVSSTEIRVTLRDPAGLVDHVLVRSRAPGKAFHEQRLGPSGGVAQLAPETEFQVFARTERKNQVFSKSARSPAAEAALAPLASSVGPGHGGVAPPIVEEPSVFESPAFWIIGGVVVAAAAGVVTAIAVTQ